MDEQTVQTVFSELTGSGVLQAKIQIRCPQCNSQHGIYRRKSEVPAGEERCFNCENEFLYQNSRSWEVIYAIAEDPGDFFQNRKEIVKHFVEGAKNLSPSFFRDEFERLEALDNPQERGRQLDGFVGLLFQQIPNVNVRLKGSTETGEVDVYMECLEAEKWIQGIVGSHTMIENKWEKTPVETSEISTFRQKTLDVHACEAAYFLSMSGYTRGEKTQTGALHTLRSYTDPKMIDLWEENLMEMIEEGSPEKTLRHRMIS